MATNILFTVPGEIRNEIYGYALHDADRPFAIDEKGQPVLGLALSRASGEIRQEILPMWALEKEKECMRGPKGKRGLKARVLDLDFDPFFDFLRCSQNASWIGTWIQRLEIHLAFSKTTGFEKTQPKLEAQWEDIAKYVAKAIRREFLGREFVPQDFVASTTDSNTAVLSLYRRPLNPYTPYDGSGEDSMLRKMRDHRHIRMVESQLNEMRKGIRKPQKSSSPNTKKRVPRAVASGSS